MNKRKKTTVQHNIRKLKEAISCESTVNTAAMNFQLKIEMECRIVSGIYDRFIA